MSLQESPFANQLNTNFVPSDAEVLSIRAFLVPHEVQLARLDEEIEATKIALIRLQHQRASLSEPIDAHKALISLVRRLPEDILMTIFSFCLPSTHNALIDPAEAPLLLGRICRHWRSVAYSNPIIWSSIHIPCTSRISCAALQKLGKVVEAWLERSASCSLDVSVLMQTPEHDDALSDARKLFSQILQVSPRLRSFEVAPDSRFLREDFPLLQLGPEGLPCLRILGFDSPESYEFNDPAALTALLRVPTLKEVSLCLTCTFNPLELPLNWTQLTRLRLECFPALLDNGNWDGGLSGRDTFNVLQMCQNLVWCKFQMTAPSADGGGPFTDGTLTLPNIQTLILSGLILHRWACRFVAPKLRYVQIGHFNPPNVQVDDEDTAAVLDVGYFTTPSLEEFLRCFPAISYLHLYKAVYAQTEGVLDDMFLERFYTPNDLCPRLNRIFIDMRAAPKFSDGAVLEFIRARMAMQPPLQEIQIQFTRWMEVDIMPELQPYIAEGLQVALQYTSQPGVNVRAGLP
ncbi:hypothetical protein R3P38DRAFT_2866991 [Favolaschia claudopus]|uniref:F-box domain-containing protein n=1 Tax=Favolaschia claudopus TaxID=2862362 RepID=A0AAW0DA13_9AGAR